LVIDNTPLSEDDLFKQRKEKLMSFIRFKTSKQFKVMKKKNEKVQQLYEKDLFVDFKIKHTSDLVTRKS